MQTRNPLQYLMITLRGLAMGAADVVPGVSGGTIAFITGIYEELILSINSVNLGVFKEIKSNGLTAAWKKINGTFLVALFAGIGISIVSLAKAISYLLENHATLVWSFFFGLVLASIVYVGKQVGRWTGQAMIYFLIGAAAAYYITELPPMGKSDEYWFIFVSGMIAICAMILPGISGSFILLILGSYEAVIGAVKEMQLAVIGIFASGCVIGLIAFSRILGWMFKKYHDLTVAVLSGFLLGSLNKIWPWKKNEELLYTHTDGKEDWLQTNVLPGNFEGDAQLGLAIACALGGFILIFGMEFIAKRLNK